MTTKPLSVAVLISAGRHPVSAAPRSCRNDAVAMALGRKLAGDSMRVLHAGNPDDPALKDYLAYGAGRIEVLTLANGGDVLGPLAGQLKDTDIVLAGSRAEQGAGSGLLAYLLAQALGRPLINDVLDVQLSDGAVQIRQFLPKGKRRLIAAPLPLVLTVHPMAPAELNYAHARQVAGKIAAIGPPPSANIATQPDWTLDPEARRPIRLKAQDNKDGHARMLSFIESPAKGGAVAFDGSPVDKAQILLTYLRDHHLVDF